MVAFRDFRSGAQIPLLERGRRPPMRSHTDTPSLKQALRGARRPFIASGNKTSFRAKELGITFRTGIGISYVTTIRNRHSEAVDGALVSQNSVPGPKSPPPERVGRNRPRGPNSESALRPGR
ncbi:hypothetical protein Taro_018817 [Colocasia esculenta]|uniref:Uncharacterized protein n=1 Tax=Colocasia esculenta TaxID=4460 RepID=A0A843UUX7_COLES|nr:hypothetical protein [Colocasia esculenta]